jgi:DnaJ-class molecular chaperone
VPRNRDFQFNLNLTLEEAFAGKTMPVAFDANGQHTNITVNIPAGIEHGTKLRFQGHGDRSIPNQPPGNLYVTVMINDHPTFQRHGPHLHTNLKIDAIAAMLGLQQDFKSIDGSTLTVSIPNGTQAGATLRLQNHGMPAHSNARQRGDLYIHIEIDIPINLTASQQDLLRQVQLSRSVDNT